MSPLFSYVAALLLVLLGTRLCFLSLRRKKLPEGLLGMFLVFGLGGLGVGYHGAVLFAEDQQLAWSLARWGTAGTSLGFAAYFLFVWQTFRPKSKLAAAGAILGGLSAFASWYILMIEQAYGFQFVPHPIAVAPRAAAVCWGSMESMAAFRRYRKRLAIGLADPVVVNRFWLFAVWNGLVLSVPLANTLLRHFHPDALAFYYSTIPWVLGLALGVVTILIFLPPEGYTRRFLKSDQDDLNDSEEGEITA